MARIYLIESGLYEEGTKDITLAYRDEEKAINFCIKKFKILNFSRKNDQNIKGFRMIWRGKNRWVLLREIVLR